MAIGDSIELLAMSEQNDQVQVFCTWEETGSRPAAGGTRPTYTLTGVRVVNETDQPVTLLLATPDGTDYWYQVAPPGDSFTLSAEQRTAVANGVSISLSGG